MKLISKVIIFFLLQVSCTTIVKLQVKANSLPEKNTEDFAVMETSGEVITCEETSCDRSVSFCKVVGTETQCPCKPGYYSSSESSTCKPGLLFAGILVVEGITRDTIVLKKDDVETFLNNAYRGDAGYSSVEVYDQEGSTKNWTYDLVYETGSGANQDSISGSFANYLTAEGCSPTDETCTIKLDSTSGNSFLLCASESVSNSGIESKRVCSSIEGYCDPDSTMCENIDGFAICRCKEDKGYVQANDEERFCSKIICSESSDCNPPFGTCSLEANDNVGVCNCIFGFSGEQCFSPWLFVFIIVGGVLLLSTLVLIIVLATRFNPKTPKKVLEERPAKSYERKGALSDGNREETGWNSRKGGMRAKVPDDFMPEIRSGGLKREMRAADNIMTNPAFEDDNDVQEAEQSQRSSKKTPSHPTRSYYNSYYSDEDSYYRPAEKINGKESQRPKPNYSTEKHKKTQKRDREEKRMGKVESEQNHHRLKSSPYNQNRSYYKYSSDEETYDPEKYITKQRSNVTSDPEKDYPFKNGKKWNSRPVHYDPFDHRNY